MITVLIVLIVLGVLALGTIAFMMMWVVKSRQRGKPEPVMSAVQAVRTETSKVGKCAECGEERIIVTADEGMCASCYSALRTKKN